MPETEHKFTYTYNKSLYFMSETEHKFIYTYNKRCAKTESNIQHKQSNFEKHTRLHAQWHQY